MQLLGVDIGGTKIETALVDGREIVREYSCPTPAGLSREEVVKEVIRAIREVHSPGIAGIGIGVPGLVDLETGEVLDVVNIPSWERLPLKHWLEAEFHKPVFVNNDANCFALGEKHFGKGQAFRNFVGIVIGTGLGGGIVINDHLYPGRFCGAGEFGNIGYRDSIVEAYASGQFFRDANLDGSKLAARAQSGDPEALRLFGELGDHIGRAIANVLFTLAPEAVILGGSVSLSFPLFEKNMHNYLENSFPFQRLYRSLQIAVSDLKNSGVLGASSLVLDALK